MLNFRKLRQDFSSNVLKEGKGLYEKSAVMEAKILHLDTSCVKISSKVKGTFENVYESEIEIDRKESLAVDSNCDCAYTYDCQHIAALLFYLENNLNEIVVAYSKETDLDNHKNIDEKEKRSLIETFQEAAIQENERKDENYQKEILCEYKSAAAHLSASPFFLKQEVLEEARAGLAVIVTNQNLSENKLVEVQCAIRLQSRSKPVLIAKIKYFLDAIRFREPITLGGKRCFFTPNSFSDVDKEILEILLNHARFSPNQEDRQMRSAFIDYQVFGNLLSSAYDLARASYDASGGADQNYLPCLYSGNLEKPFSFSAYPVHIKCALEYLEAPGPTILLNPSFKVDEENVPIKDVLLFESVKPGLMYKNTYYRFQPSIRRVHLQRIVQFHEITIPEPLFGTFIENSMPMLRKYVDVTNPSLVERFTTLPYVGTLKGRCVIQYLNGELEAELFFLYDQISVPALSSQLTYENISSFVSKEGVLARNLVEERKIIDEIFEDFQFDEKTGLFHVKSEKKIVEFMTETLPRTQDRITYECPENLLEQFIYDSTTFELHFKESEQVHEYIAELKVNGPLNGTKLDLLWDCVVSNKHFIELQSSAKKSKTARILVLDLNVTAKIVQIFDEIGIEVLKDHSEKRPLWSLASINPEQFSGIPVKFSMSAKLKEIQKQILGEIKFEPQDVPKSIQASLRNYQVEGVHWLERLRSMHLNGILADDMGLGKTLQAIVAITQSKDTKNSLIVCPTSLVYNWQEEFHKFNPSLKVIVIDSVPSQRHKLLQNAGDYNVIITSYNLLQKDVEVYKKLTFNYVVLDEAQHIKNRTTRNAKSVKMIQAVHKLILTGTPIENSLEELWSLFDFLMPGLLSSFDRFMEKYLRPGGVNFTSLKKKVAPFILRRMKADVISDLPPVSEVLYHCHLSDVQKELYVSYAKSAKEELSKLVKKEGFDKIHIHILATLTRLKQICCHPAIFAKEEAEAGDSAKYDMLMELLSSLIEGNHKTVIFSQYTKMLSILRADLKNKQIPFTYLDGSSKNRLDIVNQFNEDPSIPVFLVSLKAGGSGLNLVGADTVIHYDMWWNPAVENQATDRVHRLGQKKSVSSYKLITLNTIEEKIVSLQNRKRGLVTQVMSSDEEAMSKLTWEEVLELLQT